jgi:hypothetical protein
MNFQRVVSTNTVREQGRVQSCFSRHQVSILKSSWIIQNKTSVGVGGTRVRAGGGIDGWFDLASFVATSSSGNRSPFDELADSIGRDCYVDVAGWHLFLKDIKVEGTTSLAVVLATKLGGDMMSRGFDERDVEDALKKVPVKLGQGKKTVSLMDVMPSMCVSDLMDMCKTYAREHC